MFNVFSKENGNKCILNSHINPPLDAIKAIRKQISKSVVICPFSGHYKNHVIHSVIDTLGDDQKEGGNNNQNIGCQWKGTLNDLITKHISQCAQKNDPMFAANTKIVGLEQKIKVLKNQLVLKQVELDTMNQENARLKVIIQAKNVTIDQLSNELNEQFEQNKQAVNVNSNIASETNILLNNANKENERLNNIIVEMKKQIKEQAFMAEIDAILKPSKINNNNNNNMSNNNNKNNNNKKIIMNDIYDAIVENTYLPGDIITNASATMAWNIKNTGNKSFGNNCKLAFVSGDGLLVSHYNIPNAKPLQSVKVSMDFNAFSRPGIYQTNFRLCCNGKQFGPQLIVKINVIHPQRSEKEKEKQRQKETEQRERRERERKERERQTTLFPSNNNINNKNNNLDSNDKKGSNLSCLCGSELVYLDVKQAYKGKKVHCDICSKVCKQCVFHCPNGDIIAHPGGFDLCHQCGGSQLAKQPNPSPTEMLLTTDSGNNNNNNMSYPPNKNNNNNDDTNFVYPSLLKQLLDMGFDKDNSRRLLLKNRGNMSQVLAELIK